MTAKSRCTSLRREGNPGARRLPLELQHRARVLRLDGDREPLDRLRELLDPHGEPGEVVRGIVVGAPLPRVPVDDERPPAGRGDRPERVGAGGWTLIIN